MKPLPAYLQKHQAAQDAGHFTPYPTAETMNAIVTPARNYSARNRKRHTVLRRVLTFAGLAVALALFWVSAFLYFTAR